MFSNPSDDELCGLLSTVRTIAVVGLSPQPARPCHRIARALQKRGYRIIPVRPLVSEVLGERAYGRLRDIGEPVDLVNVFRNAREIDAVVDDCLALGVKRLWIQLGIVNEPAAARARDGGMQVVMDRCIWTDLNGVCAGVIPSASATGR